ncbi:MAG: DUF192 domain-containing protein [Patescibacteria group bacterium]
MLKTIAIIIVCIIVIGIMFYSLMTKMQNDNSVHPSTMSPLPTAIVDIDGSRNIAVELATTDASREQGLSDRASLADDRGMLFIFPTAVIQQFWMNRMHFPLDIIFIKDGVVVDIAPNLPAPKVGQFPAVVRSKIEADQVLEINAGKAAEWGIRDGSIVKIMNSAASAN